MLSALTGLFGSCDMFQEDGRKGREARSVLLLFRIEAEDPPDGGWMYWYVEDGVLYQRGSEGGLGPFGATVDCGSHAGIYASVSTSPGQMTLIIETVEDEPSESMAARKSVTGSGEHQLIVIAHCP